MIIIVEAECGMGCEKTTKIKMELTQRGDLWIKKLPDGWEYDYRLKCPECIKELKKYQNKKALKKK